MRYLNTLAIAATFISTFACANALSIGKTLPAASVYQHGELVLNAKDVTYIPWRTESLKGKVRIVQAMAGRKSAKALMEPLNKALKAAFKANKSPQDNFQTTVIVNQDDAIWGTGGFVKSSVEENKRKFSDTSFVLDANGSVSKAWNLQKESAAIIILDELGRVQFIKEGALSNDDVINIIKIVNERLG